MKHQSKLAAGILLALVVAASGCTQVGDQTSKEAGELANDSGIDTTGVNPGSSFWAELLVTEKNQQRLVRKVPIPKMEQSLERGNLKRRYETLNDRDKVFHVYLMSDMGDVISYFTAKGKVSSVNSKLTQQQHLVRIPDCDAHNSGNDCWKVVDSPQLDGSYGTNGDAVFFYTTDGSYVEWNGKYVVSERPLSINTPVSLEKQVE